MSNYKKGKLTGIALGDLRSSDNFFAVALNTVQDYYLRPKLVEKKGAVHPILTILAFGAPFLVIGVTGLVIGPAIHGFLLAFYRTKLKLKEEEKMKEDT